MEIHRRYMAWVAALGLLTGCPSPNPPDVLDFDVTPVDGGPEAATGMPFCTLTGGGTPSGVSLPPGFCIHTFAQVTEPRTLVFAPNGDLFVGAPSENTAGGAAGGPASILVLSDDNHDGVAEIATFTMGLNRVHGLAFADGWLYFTSDTTVWRTPYATGQRQETPGMRTLVSTFGVVDAPRWTHGLAHSVSGAIYATQGVYSAMTCPDSVRNGTIERIDQPGGPQLMADGFRNPMYVRCHPTDDVCLASELGDDGGPHYGAFEQLVRIGRGTNYGFPCCTTTNATTPYNTSDFDCSMVPPPDARFPLNDTPFGLDWERSTWPEPFRGGLMVALHGSYYSNPSWAGAAIVFAPTDPVSHLPSGDFVPIVEGFGHSGTLSRPADVAFAADGRMFFSDDQGNGIYWVAPGSLRMP